jgi:hypothetical protein
MAGSKHRRQKNKRVYLAGISKSRTLARRVYRATQTKSKGKPVECMDRVKKRIKDRYPDLFDKR